MQSIVQCHASKEPRKGKAGGGATFEVVTKGRTYIFVAKTAREREAWIEAVGLKLPAGVCVSVCMCE